MSIEILCSVCNTIVGSDSSAGGYEGVYSDGTLPEKGCPGKYGHPEPKRVIESFLKGIIYKVEITYPETKTTTTRLEYVGPCKQSSFRIALIFAKSKDAFYGSIFVNGKWCSWCKCRGFFGPSAEDVKTWPKQYQ